MNKFNTTKRQVMKLQTKIKIDFWDFIKNGKFDCIKLGQTKEWILNNFPDPDNFSADFLSSKYNIWTYGNIEFHFNKSSELFLIYSDYLDKLDGGDNLELNKWIFETFPKLNLIYVITKLNEQEIDYCKSSEQFCVRLTTKNGVELGFEKDNIVSDPNQLHMTYFGLRDKE